MDQKVFKYLKLLYIMQQNELEILGQKFSELLEQLNQEHEYWYHCWNAKECNSGNCRLLSLAICNVSEAIDLIAELKIPKTI